MCNEFPTMCILPMLFIPICGTLSVIVKRSLLLAAVLLLSIAAPVLADEPPPLPTLVPPGVIAEQFYQLQGFEMVQAYDIYHTTSYTATVNGAVWAVERRFTYGEAGITLVAMALVLVQVAGLTYRVVTRER